MLTLALHVRYFFHGLGSCVPDPPFCFLYKALQERGDHSALSFIDTLSRKQTLHLSQAGNTLMCEKDTATLPIKTLKLVGSSIIQDPNTKSDNRPRTLILYFMAAPEQTRSLTGVQDSTVYVYMTECECLY